MVVTVDCFVVGGCGNGGVSDGGGNGGSGSGGGAQCSSCPDRIL